MTGRRRRPARPAVWALAAFILPACPDAGFDPRGNEVGIAFGWTVEGAPPTPALCASLGAVRARLLVRSGAGARIDRDLEWPCEAGRAETTPIFRPATLDLAVELLDVGGGVAAYGGWLRRTLGPATTPVGTFDLSVSAPPPDASLSVAWTIDGAPAAGPSCAALGGATVRLSWLVGGLEGAPFDWPCADGAGATGPAFRSAIDFRLRLLDTAGSPIARSRWFREQPLEPGDNPLGTIDLSTHDPP